MAGQYHDNRGQFQSRSHHYFALDHRIGVTTWEMTSSFWVKSMTWRTPRPVMPTENNLQFHSSQDGNLPLAVDPLAVNPRRLLIVSQPTSLTEGTHVITLTAVDEAGALGQTTVTIDRHAGPAHGHHHFPHPPTSGKRVRLSSCSRDKAFKTNWRRPSDQPAIRVLVLQPGRAFGAGSAFGRNRVFLLPERSDGGDPHHHLHGGGSRPAHGPGHRRHSTGDLSRGQHAAGARHRVPNLPTYDYGTNITFTGSATDDEPPVPDGNFTWYSIYKGITQTIGSGTTFQYSGLQPGDHTIQLKVVDIRGRTGYAQRVITIVEPAP